MSEEKYEVIYSRQKLLELSIDFTEDEPTESLLEKRQFELEKEMHQLALDGFYAGQDKLKNTRTASSSATFLKATRKYISDIIKDMENNYKLLSASIKDSTINGTSPELIKVIERFEGTIGFERIAAIGFSEVVNSLHFGKNKAPTEDTLIINLVEMLDHQAFLLYLESIDPRLFKIVSRFNLNNPSSGVKRRIKASVEYLDDIIQLDWEWLTPAEGKRFGNWVKDRIFHGSGLFESTPIHFNKKDRWVIILSEFGEQEIDTLESQAAANVGNCWPMLIPPKSWKDGVIGGYITPQPGSRSHLIHNHSGTIESEVAREALNNLQSVPWRINQFILDIQTVLSKRTYEIGSFRTFDEETYRLQKPLIENQETTNISWDTEDEDELRKKKKAYGVMKEAEKEEKSTAQKTIATGRSLEMAERFSTEEEFYLPWYFDNRLRQYCSVDTLNPQGSDNVKALIEFAVGVEKSEDSYEDLLVSIATTFGNGLDKLSYEKRVEGAKRMISKFPLLVKDVESATSKMAMDFWTNAEEPFQFLALAREYYLLYQKEYKEGEERPTKHHVSSGRDATCSGIQIAGALLRDSQTCFLVNVTPSSEVQDAYKAVAQEAKKLINDPIWLDRRVRIRETGRAKKAEKAKAEALDRKAKGLPELKLMEYEPRFACEIPLDLVDRSVAKMIVMLTPYGGSYQTMLQHVQEKMIKKGSNMIPADYSILTHALIEGMAVALPGFSALNQWFKDLGRARIAAGHNQIIWTTPAGSEVKQEYFELEEDSVKTFSYGEVKYNRYLATHKKSARTLKERKMMTALAANTVHSLDASIIQIALSNYSGESFTAVHDCVYAPSGAIRPLTKLIRDAFYNVVSGDFLHQMLVVNELAENDQLVSQLKTMTHEDNGLLESIKDSQYLFS